jgi:glutamate synthase (NADPH/NADH) small chain
MAERLNNDFQFLDVARQDPEKKDIAVRKAEFVEIYNRLVRMLHLTRLIAV